MANPAYHHLYNCKRWRDKRDAQLAREPLCELCLKLGMVTPATVADHRIPHRGDINLFWDGELASLCDPCHKGPKAHYEATGKMRGCDTDGYPVEQTFEGEGR